MNVTAASEERFDSRFTCGRIVLLLAGLLFLAYPEVIRGTHTFFYRDFGSFAYPLAHYLRESFWRGELPLWNPLSECGVPFAAQWTPMVYYPGSLFLMLVPLRWSLGFFSFAHLLLAGASMYALAHRWTGRRFAASFAALTFAANGMMLHSLMWPHYLAAFAWMPLVVLWTERAVCGGRRAILIAAGVGAIQMLSGAPEPILFTWLAALAWVASLRARNGVTIKTMVLRFGAIVALVSALTAIQLWPFLDLLLHSRRYGESKQSDWALPLWGFCNYLVPMFHTIAGRIGVYTQRAQQFVTSYYVGVGTIALALWSAVRVRERRVRTLLLVICVGFFFALGDNNPLYSALREIFPALAWSRYPVKWLVLVTFALPLLAARALAKWQEERRAQDRISAATLVGWTGACLLVLIGWISFSAFRAPVEFENPSLTFDNAFLRALALVVTIAILFPLARGLGGRARTALAVLLLIITALDLVTNTPRQNPVVLTDAYEPMELRFPTRPQAGESRALLTTELRSVLAYPILEDPLSFYSMLRRGAMANCNLIDGVPILSGFWPLSLREYSRVVELFYPETNSLPETNMVPERLADFLGMAVRSSLDLPCEWYDRPSRLPLITGGQQPIFADPEKTLRAIASAEFDPRHSVYLPLEERDRIRVAPDAAVKVERGAITAHEWNFTVEANAPALVTIAQTFYHPWSAWVDGRPQRLLRANYAFQALEVGSGTHTVRLRYVDWAFRIGAAVSLAGILLAGFLWLHFREEPPRDAPETIQAG